MERLLTAQITDEASFKSPEEQQLDRYRADPAAIMRDAGFILDPWQEQVLRSTAKEVILLCSRKSGKSQVVAAIALLAALINPNYDVVVVCPTLDQASEMIRYVMQLYHVVGDPVAQANDMTSELWLVNGSRVRPKPGKEASSRGPKADLLIIDEGSRLLDIVYGAVCPMRAANANSRLVVLSTPFGKRGWFYKAWAEEKYWEKIGPVTADECPRISQEFLDREREKHPERTIRQEYYCSFEEAQGTVFPQEQIDRAFDNDIEPLILEDIEQPDIGHVLDESIEPIAVS